MVQNVLFSHKSDEWETPQGFFDELNGRYHFDLDVCSTKENRKCLRYFTKQDDGLSRKWGGRVWCNPPYSDITSWVRKAHEEVSSGRCEVVVMLVPARTDTRWFHDWCYNKRGVEIKFVKGRLKFGGAKHNAPFPSMVVVFRRENGHEESA